MNEIDGENEVRRGWLRWLGTGLGLLTLVILGLWTQRAPIAENFLGRELNRRGVAARYDLAAIGLRTQRIENIVLGDPADPDLVARSVEVDIAFAGLTPRVAAVRADGVRIRGSLRNGILSLGEVDKFRDSTSTAPFSLPDIVLALKDARMRLDTDAGAVGLKLDGEGNLHSGFRGRMAAVMPKARLADCGLVSGTALLNVAIRDGRPHLSGPVGAGAFACRSAGVALAKPDARIDVTLGQALDRWSGSLAFDAQALKAQDVVLGRPAIRSSFEGDARVTRGQAKLRGHALTIAGALAQTVTLDAAWSYAGGSAMTAKGMMTARNVRPTGPHPLRSAQAMTAGTPVGPLMDRLSDAIDAAGRDNLLRSRFAFARKGTSGSLILDGTQFDAASGARVGMAPDSRVTMAWGGAGFDWALDGSLKSEGGGLPRAALRLVRRPGGGMGGQLFMDAYAAAGARLTAEPVRFTAAPGGVTRFSTIVRLDGPLADGAIAGLVIPLEGDVAAGRGVKINPRCVPLSLARARYGDFSVAGLRQTLCPIERGALLAYGPQGMRGGAEIRSLDIKGHSGDSPMRLTADRARFALADGGFALANMALSIGQAASPVRLTATGLTGRSGAGGLNGRLDGASARIGTVPLLVEAAEGAWGFTSGVLTLGGSLVLKDSQAPDRFNPLSSRDFVLTMSDGRIRATGNLLTPRNSATVATVDIVHDLSSGRGSADLKVPGLAFNSTLQPEDVTRLALGVVANVEGRVTGEGQVLWTGDRVTSTGVFRTSDANLAAAFGPVEGLSGEIRFTDLIGLVSAPGQLVTMRVVNPGVEVRDGVVRYRLEPGQKVHIEGGEWPFSGGRLALLPTTLDFAADVDRYLTFRVVGLDAGAFIQTMELDNISATGTFDGIMPLIFDADGGRIAGGVLVARQLGMPPLLMPEGVLPTIPCDPARQSGVLSYVGPVSNEQLGTFGKLAFDALKNLQYKCLTILMDGALDGEMVTNVVFNGVNRGQVGVAPVGLASNFTGLPFIFNVRISAPFRGLLGTAKSFIDPTILIRNSIGDSYQQKLREGLAVQPAESDTVPNGEQK
ncbi:YdbH domain-containing protein [Sphingobium sp. AN641]|uniref:intermembrane phospholipid transport protein YdbH family protein n=1 Tax=Sphingobium sp. AN641 TaxID=3133443 RepID=UPI0030C34265